MGNSPDVVGASRSYIRMVSEVDRPRRRTFTDQRKAVVVQQSAQIAGPTSTQGLTPAKRLVAQARARIENLAVEQLTHELQHEQVVLVDLREQAERDVHGAIPGTVHIPRGMLEFCADPTLPVHAEKLDPGSRIVLYCAAGNRSALAALTLKAIGFLDVAHLDGGFEAWRRAGGSIEAPSGTEAACWVHLLQR
jgi:rhodanese-related sulfurtransferase